MSEEADDQNAGQGHVFLSYSRKDTEFTRRLHDELAKRGRKTWADWEGIPPSDKWMARIHAAIDEAQAVLFIISPDSLDSTVCGEELDFSFGRNKRVIPVLHREPVGEVRQDLAELNWIFARPSDDLQKAVERIVEAVDTDLAWVHAHTRLLVRAAEWDRRERDTSYALRGRDLREFETMQAAGTDKEPRLTRLQSEYLLDSRRATTRRQQLTWGAVTAAVIVASILGTLAWLQSQERARQAEIAGARRLLSQAEVLRETPQAAQIERRKGLRAATEALATLERVGADWTDADRAVRQGYASVDKWQDPVGRRDDWQVDNAAVSSDSRYVLLFTKLGEMVVLDVADGTVRAECRRPLHDQTESRGAYNRRVAVASDAQHVAVRASGGTNVTGGWSRLEVWDMQACARIAERKMGDDDPEEPAGLTFTMDGSALLYWTRDIARIWRFSEDTVESLKMPRDTREFAPAPDAQQGIASVRTSGDRSYRLQVLDLASGDVIDEWISDIWVRGLAWDIGGIVVSRWEDYAVFDPDGRLKGTVALEPAGASAVSADGKLAAITPDQSTIEVWSFETGEPVARAYRENVLDLAFTHDSDGLVVVGDYRFDIELWHFREAGAYARLPPRGEADRLAFDASGRLLHADDGGARTSWRLPDATGQLPEVVPEEETVAPPPHAGVVEMAIGPETEVLTVAHGRPDRSARLVCTDWTRGGCRRVLEVWEGGEKRADLPFEPVLDIDQSAFLQFAGNDIYLVVGTRAGLEIRDWQSLDPVGELFAPDVRLAEVSPGLGRAATSGPDGAIRVWNMADNTEVARIDPPDGIRDMALSDDDRWLAVLTAAGDRVDLFALAPSDLVAQACRWLDPPCP